MSKELPSNVKEITQRELVEKVIDLMAEHGYKIVDYPFLDTNNCIRFPFFRKTDSDEYPMHGKWHEKLNQKA